MKMEEEKIIKKISKLRMEGLGRKKKVSLLNHEQMQYKLMPNPIQKEGKTTTNTVMVSRSNEF